MYDAHFRCIQPIQGFYKIGENTVDVLLQPVDMDPDGVAAYDCGYNVVMGIPGAPDGETTVTVYRRWDNWNDGNEPVLIGSAVATILE